VLPATITYVNGTWMDAAGRVELRVFGADQIRTDYNYNAWNTQGGRLQWVKSGTPNGNTVNATLQNLTYSYDLNANVTDIVDALAGGSQSQHFTYDNQERLIDGATTTGTGGLYSQLYSYDSYGRLLNGPQGTGYTYNTSHKHAVATAGGISYGYDANGNMSSRGGYAFNYDAENRLVSVSGTATAGFVYDGDNNRVKGTIGGVTSIYIGNYYEVAGSTVKKYYYAGNQRVAMKSGTTLYWLLSDHLGGTAITVSGTTESGETRYYPFGTDRFTSGATPTSFKSMGQRQETDLAAKAPKGFPNPWLTTDVG
jgi:hypothetical protein